MITIKIIDAARKQDIRIPNHPFRLYGRMIPSYEKEKWKYEVEYLPEEDITEMCFPNEEYDYDAMISDSVFVGAYDGDNCIGLAVLQDGFFQYMYLYDLKVDPEYRGQHVGTMLIDKAKEIAQERGYRGLYTQGQDNNLGACLFYIRSGFVIGGLDTQIYKGTSQENKKDIIFYFDI